MAESHRTQRHSDQAAGSPITDSGYDSTIASPQTLSASLGGKLPDIAESQSVDNVANQSPYRRDTILGLQIFDATFSSDVLLRFQDVHERIREPLLSCLRKTRKEFRPMAIRLMSLGRDEDSAKPWIVVLCPIVVEKKVRRFFQEDLARRLCQPDGLGTVCFEVAIVGPPRRKAIEQPANVDVALMGTTKNERQHWALRVKVEHLQWNRFATLDGFVIVTDSTHKESIYGLTAGHILVQNGIGEDASGSEEASFGTQSSSDDESFDPGSGTYTSDLPSEQRHIASVNTGRIEEPMHWSNLGHLSMASFSTKARDRDWALIEDIKVPGFQDKPPPLIIENFRLSNILKEDLSLLDGVQLGFGPSHGYSSCRFSSPAIAILPYGTDFVDVYTLALGKDEGT